MLQFGNKILEYLESILDKIIESTNRVEDIKSVGVVKTESINLSKDIFTEKGDLFVLNKYIDDLINSEKSSGIINEILIKTKDLINRDQLEKKIFGAWNRYSIDKGKLNNEIIHWKDLDFKYISKRYDKVVEFFETDLKKYESSYHYLNGTTQTTQTDEFDIFFSRSYDNIVLQLLVKKKYDEILLEVFALLDLTLLRINEFLESNNTFLKEKSYLIELNELDKFESTKNHIYKNPVAINVFEKIVNDNTFLFTLSDFSQLFRFIEENNLERIQHKPYLEYIVSRFKYKIDSSFKSMKIEKAKHSKQIKFANIVNN
jgi:hypothetical protein